jgi:N-dimethylarginine dimethylaminohydrolase
MATTAHILMCRPDHFAVTYAINPWMDPNAWARDGQALANASHVEWKRLYRTLSQHGAAVELLPAMPGLPDMVFTANAAVVLDGKALLARFRHPERQREEAHFDQAFRALKACGQIDAIERMPDGLVLEGAGDCVWDRSRQMFWMGYGPRSDAAARGVVEAAFGVDVVALELADPRFYHMDTALCPLPRGEVMYFPGGFTAPGLAAIRARVEPALRIELDAEDAGRLAANAVCLGDAIVLSRCSSGLRWRLEQRGYGVVETPLGSFQRGGGSAFCLTLQLDRVSAQVNWFASPAAMALPVA